MSVDTVEEYPVFEEIPFAFHGQVSERFRHDPLGYADRMFPWGMKGSALYEERFSSLDGWHREVLGEIGSQLRSGKKKIFIAVSSGRGIGKTALSSILTNWFHDCYPHGAGVVTAGTRENLTSKTWREISKWRDMSRTRGWSDKTTERLKNKVHPSTWFVSALSWNEEKPGNFYGTHETRGVFFLMDEASEIPDVIWVGADGSMTDDVCIWLVFSNPRKTSGRFYECFHKFRHRWTCYQIDSRTCRLPDKEYIKTQIEDWGEDSDYVRVEILGQFPRQSISQFINADDVRACMKREVEPSIYEGQPIIFGVDVARFGSGESVIAIRQGRRLHRIERFRGYSTIDFAKALIAHIGEWRPAAVFIDEVGVGAGPYDYLVSLGWSRNLFGVQSGGRAENFRVYTNKRAEMWGRMRDWLKTGSMNYDETFLEQAVSVEAGFSRQKGTIQLEGKDNLEKRGVKSPDLPDALAFTFAEKVFSTGVYGVEEEDYNSPLQLLGRSPVTGY